MDFSSLLRDVGLPIIDNLTGSLQGVITIEPWIGTDDYSKPTYGTAVNVDAIIEDASHLRRVGRSKEDIVDGQESQVKTVLTIPRPLSSNGAAGRREPIDPRDRVTLPGGVTGPILNVDGVIDPLTGKPYMFTVELG